MQEIEGTMTENKNNNHCYSYADGHHLHYIAVNKASKDRVPATVEHLGGAAFLVKVEGKAEAWFTHSPEELQLALATATAVEATKDRTWLFVKGMLVTQGFNLSKNQLTACIKEQKPLDMSSIMKMVKDRETKG